VFKIESDFQCTSAKHSDQYSSKHTSWLAKGDSEKWKVHSVPLFPCPTVYLSQNYYADNSSYQNAGSLTTCPIGNTVLNFDVDRNVVVTITGITAYDQFRQAFIDLLRMNYNCTLNSTSVICFDAGTKPDITFNHVKCTNETNCTFVMELGVTFNSTAQRMTILGFTIYYNTWPSSTGFVIFQCKSCIMCFRKKQVASDTWSRKVWGSGDKITLSYSMKLRIERSCKCSPPQFTPVVIATSFQFRYGALPLSGSLSHHPNLAHFSTSFCRLYLLRSFYQLFLEPTRNTIG